MSSTYSNLKFQLMATGENSTTWGNVTNINLGTAIQEAIAGSADVAFSSANVTISLTDTNASQAARNMRLNLTGTATSGYNLVVPTIEKVYIVNNGTDGTITVKTSAGTGIAIPTGKTMWVVVDGTNVVNATTHLTSLTLETPLPVTSGGTGGNTASAARTALELGTIATQNANAVAITGGSITGITDLAVADGGTGASTNSAALVNLLPTYTNNASKVLALNSGATDVEWTSANVGGGTVTSVAASGGTTGFSFTGSPITTSGTLTLSGTLDLNNGGTGATTASAARSALGAAASGANTDITSLAESTTVSTSGTPDTNTIGYRGLPQSTNATATIDDIGKSIYRSSSMTVPQNVFSAGDSFAVINSTSGSINITQGSGVTLRLAGTATTGTRALAGYGMATVVCSASNVFYVAGAGVS